MTTSIQALEKALKKIEKLSCEYELSGTLEMIWDIATQALADYHKSKKEDWISVEDELPQDMTPMIVAGKYGRGIITMSDTAYYDNEKQRWFDHSNDFQLVNNFITHWRLLPAPPVNQGDVAGSQTNSIDKK